jgi:trans-aconitate 2-methyltransferase
MFQGERTRPCRDLVARIALDEPRALIDLGCGPGNSTAVLGERWPRAKVTGLDNSTAMLERASQSFPQYEWIRSDIAEMGCERGRRVRRGLLECGAAMGGGSSGHLPAIAGTGENRRVLAIQVPANMDAPPHQIMRDLASSPTWRDYFPTGVREWHVHEAAFYYDMLSSYATRLDLWETEYIHVMPDAESIGEWYKGSGLRPFLDVLPDDPRRERFVEDYVSAVRDIHTPRRDGRVLFPFRRLFLIAYK